MGSHTKDFLMKGMLTVWFFLNMKWKLHIRRKLFFLLDRWHVPHAERIWLLLLMGISVVSWTVQTFIPHPEGLWSQEYIQEREQFERLFATHIQNHNERMQRYGSVGEPHVINPISEIEPYPPVSKNDQLDSVWLDLNKATASELQQIKGIGPSIAQKILDWRRQNGRFDSLGQLIDVKGIGPKSLQKMRPFLFVRDSVDLEVEKASPKATQDSDATNPDSTNPDSTNANSTKTDLNKPNT
jgi:comEA protein